MSDEDLQWNISGYSMTAHGEVERGLLLGSGLMSHLRFLGFSCQHDATWTH